MQFCEFCGNGGYCPVCGVDQDVARWEDDGGRVASEWIDHDAETKEAETLRECQALTTADLGDDDERTDWVVFWFLAVGGTLWLAATVVAVLTHGQKRW